LIIGTDQNLPGADFGPSTSNTVLGGGGHVAIPGGGASNGGLWIAHDEEIDTLVRTGDPAPGLEEGSTFRRLDSFAIDSTGTVAFDGSAETPDGDFVEGIWFGTPGQITLAVAEGQPLVLSDGTVGTFNGTILTTWTPTGTDETQATQDGHSTFFNDDGVIAFIASFFSPTAGDNEGGGIDEGFKAGKFNAA